MTELYTGSVADFFADEDNFGTAIPAPTKKIYTGSVADFFDGKSEEQEIFESTIPENKKLKIDDFYRPSNLNTIREYMTRHKGDEYRTTKNDSKLVNDFVDHMRWFNTNTLSLAGEVQFVRKGSDADRAAAADAYRLYDGLGNLFNSGYSLTEKLGGIKDYVFAAATDPSNYIGLVTGGLGKAATLGVTETSKKALKAVTKQAYKEAVKKGASSQAVSKAVTEAQESLIKKLSKDAVKSGAGKVALDHAAMNARREALRTIGMGAVRDIEKKRRLKGVAAELGGTFTADATVAAFQDLAIQDIYLDVNVDDSVTTINKKQVLLNGLIGGAVAPAFSLAGSGAKKLVGGSSLGDATREMALKKFSTKGTVDAGVSFEATKVIRDGYKSWAKKVEAGKEIRGNQMMPEGLLGEILLGPDKETGLVGFLRSKGITVNKDTFISDFLTDVIRVMPDEEFLAMSKDFEKATGLPLGDVATAKVKLSDVIASYSSGLGRELSVFAQAKNKLNAGVVMGNDIINQSLERKEIRDALEDGLPGYLSRAGSFKEGVKVKLKSNQAKKGKILSIEDGVATVVFEGARKKAKVKTPELKVGSRVRPSDRGNVGTIVALRKDSADVKFVNKKDKTTATVTFNLKDLTGGAGKAGEPAARKYNLEELDLIADPDKQPKKLMYLQNVWRRTLVSSVPTTAANVFGWSQYYLGQSIADSLNGGLFYAYGMLRGNTEAGREARRVGQVYFQVQGAKFRNLLDSFTTHDAYMKFLDENKEIKSLIHETAGGTGVELSASKFDINPDSKVYKTIEGYVNAATKITGVRAQDTFTKSQMFMTELDKHLRIKKGIKLADAMRDNNLNVIDEDIAGLAMDSTMKSVFSKDYTTVEQAPAIRSAAKFVESISNLPVLGSVLPFGRFFNNTIATVYQLGPWSLLPATAKIMRGRGDIQTMEAFSRAAVGTAGLIMAARMDQERQDKGLEATELDVGGGTVIDTKNAFPMSEFLAMGRVVNQLGRQGSLGILGTKVDLPGKPAEPTVEKGVLPYYATTTPEAIQDMLVQIGVGQFAKDIQFGNDMNRIINMFFDETNGEAGVAELQRRGGSFLAGFTRPFQTIDRAVGFIRDTDIHKDKRQKSVINDEGEVELVARTGGDIFSLEATRYVDNIFQYFSDVAEQGTLLATPTKRPELSNLRVATREGDLYDPNPLNSIFGVRVVPSKTASEKVYTMAGLKGFKASRRSAVAMYDRLLNETISPILERKARELLSDKKFMQGTNTYRRKEVKKILKQTRSAVNEAMPYLSRHHKQNKHKYDVINYAGDSEQFKNAKKLFHELRLEKLKDEGATDEELKKLKMKTPLDMSESELNQFKAILSLYRDMKKE